MREAAEPLRGRLRQRAGSGLQGPQLVGSRTRSARLSRNERLLCGMQQIKDALPHRARFLLRGPDHRDAALLDDQQRSLDAPRQLRRPDRRVQRLPPLRQLRMVYGRACGKLFGFNDQRFGTGERQMLPFP